MTSPYSDAEFDAEVLRTQRSDWSYVGAKAATLAVVFFFLARAVLRGASAEFLLLPLAVEFLSIMWVGLFLGYFVIDCPKFIAAGRKPIRVILWTSLILGAISALLAWDDGAFHADRVRPGWLSAWQEILSTGLIWAMVAEVLGLGASTAREVFRWRQERGTFVWNSIFAPSLRIATVILIGILSPFVLIPLADSLVPWLFENPRRMAWTAFGFLLFVELGGLAIGVGMHRDSESRAGSRRLLETVASLTHLFGSTASK